EIPGSQEHGGSAASTRGQFISGALDRKDDCSAAGGQHHDKEQIQQLTEAAFKKGRDQGRTEAIAEQQEAVDQGAAALARAVEEIVRVRQQDVDRMETETVRLALAIAKKVIGHEAEYGPVIHHVLKAAMKKVVDTRHLTVRLNPQDIDTVNGFKQELILADDFGAHLRLEADEAILRGGCIIETKLGDLDARIDQQIKIIEDLLNEQLPKPATKG
ncbi:FliH/SctL family protein, partial [Desulfosarcina sp.]|uniref:FliH/SctL family protein n=1 Tax=Desulfosarcina sp. TaxID=2027861 RepID=UPI003562D120